jgi:arylformamidase
MNRIIDLTLTLKPGMRGFKMESMFTVARDGWNASKLHLYSHCGTHMDAPAHFEAGPETIDQIPLGRCMGRAWVVKLDGIAPKALMDVTHLGNIAGQVAAGDILLFHTGWSRYVDDPSLYRDGLPRFSEPLARWCAQKRVKLVGVEPPSVADLNNKPEVTLIHHILLAGGVTIVEGLTSLDQLREEQAFFAALPLKPLAGDGSPCRAFAIEGIPPHGWLANEA